MNPSLSAGRDNVHYFWCPTKEQRVAYAGCLDHPCTGVSRCDAQGMRQQELLEGRAIYFRPMTVDNSDLF